MALNHYLINQTIQAKMVPGRRHRFGQFGVLGIAGNMLKFQPRPSAKVEFNIESDRQVLNAFLKVSDGASAESVLLDPKLAARFHLTARKMGLHAPAADMNRRLINIRKNPARYKNHGIVLPPATKIEPHPSIVPRFAHVIEFSLSRLHSRYGVSIDDILIDPDLALEYEKMVLSAAPGLSLLEIRLAALYIRKTRYISKSREELVQSLPTEAIETAFHEVGTVAVFDLAAVPTGEGVIEVLDANKHLYISRSEDLRSAVDQITSESSLKFMANDFWQPKRESLLVRVFAGHQFLGTKVSEWQLKLISEKKPVFNWPIAA